MKKFVVEVMAHGKVQTRLVPARTESEARRNCCTKESSVISCVPYTGQKIKVSAQEDFTREEKIFRGYLAANRRRKGGFKCQQQQNH